MARAKAKRPSPAAAPPATPARGRRGWTAPRKALLALAVVLVVTADDRQAGRVSDSRQMIQTAVALATTGELGVARGVQFATTARGEGDASVRYGLGMPLAQLPAAIAAPTFDRAFGAGGSQFLFLLAPILLGLAAAAGAARIAALLGAGERGQAAALLLASVGSPLGPYMTSDLSEALQAAALTLAVAFSLASRRAEGKRAALLHAAAAGAAAGVAVLAKSSLVAVAPFTLLPLLAAPPRGAAPGAGARIAAAAGGALPPLAAFVAVDLARFGGLFQGYAGESFSYPFLLGDGRLLVFPNKGLLLFFPALAVAAWGAWARLRPVPAGELRDPRLAAALEAAACLLPLAALLGLAAPWWAWHGVAGWGPRLLVPALPPVAALAAVAAEAWRAPRLRLLVAGSVALNALGFLQSNAGVAAYTTRLAPVAATEEVARRFPRYEGKAPDGSPLVPGAFVVHEVPSAADHVLHAWLLRVRSASSVAERAARLARPPWRASRPDLVSLAAPFPPAFTEAVAPPLTFGVLGSSMFGPPSPAKGKVYVDALANQVMRAQQLGRGERSLDLAARLFALDPRPESAALLAESYRLLGRHEMLRAYLDSLPRDLRATPPVFAVIALAARDAGETEAARAYMERAAALGTPGVEAALALPPSRWPDRFVALVSRSELTSAGALPGAGGRPGAESLPGR